MGFNKQNYDNQYQKDNYDRIIVNAKPKGKKKIIDDYRKKKGYDSLKQYIIHLIEKDMEEGQGGG